MKFLISLLAAVSLIVTGVPALKVNAQAQEILKPTAYTFSGSGTNENPGNAYDGSTGGEDISYNRLGVGDNNNDPTIEYHTWQTPSQSHTDRRLYVRRSGTGNSDDTWGIYYSTNGGAGYTAIEIGLTDLSEGNTTAVVISNDLELSDLRVKIVTSMYISSDGGYADIWDVWLEGDYTDISNSHNSYPFGTLSEGSITETGLTHFTVTNNSAFAVNITIGGTDMTGVGDTWELSDTATQGTNRYGLKAGLELDSYNIIVKKIGPFNPLVSGLVASDTRRWGLQLLAPTLFTDGVAKEGTVTLTATQAE